MCFNYQTVVHNFIRLLKSQVTLYDRDLLTMAYSGRSIGIIWGKTAELFYWRYMRHIGTSVFIARITF
jgi:hypothetical protein